MRPGRSGRWRRSWISTGRSSVPGGGGLGKIDLRTLHGRVTLKDVPPSPHHRPPEDDPMNRSRREFLAGVGRGALVASVGTAVAADLGLADARAADRDKELTFGKLE